MERPLGYHEQLRRQKILSSMANLDYLLVIASQQQKSVQQCLFRFCLTNKSHFCGCYDRIGLGPYLMHMLSLDYTKYGVDDGMHFVDTRLLIGGVGGGQLRLKSISEKAGDITQRGKKSKVRKVRETTSQEFGD